MERAAAAKLLVLSALTGCRERAPPPSGTAGAAAASPVAAVSPAAAAAPVAAAAPAAAASPVAAPNRPAEASAYGPTLEGPAPGREPPPEGMVWIPGGEFSMGGVEDVEDTDGAAPRERCGPSDDARPVHRVRLDGFWMDRTEVTNEQFERFVRATGYVTIAERTPTAAEFPGAPPENLVAGSVVFAPPPGPVPLDSQFRWWTYIKGASWRQPAGRGSSIRGREHYPVVHVAYDDAVAYARWARKRLPTEAEFEFAARGGLAGKHYAWGDDLRPAGQWMANTFQGHFPDHDTGDDGWDGLAPVASFPSNGYGLYDVAGNVWEWVSDWYRPDTYAALAVEAVARNPQGPPQSFDPAEPGVPKRVQRGGSFLCTNQYCSRYLVGSRGKGDPSTGADHLGFRCVRARRGP
jgi:formylglycine-generating enzyme required for sulfatase activity